MARHLRPKDYSDHRKAALRDSGGKVEGFFSAVLASAKAFAMTVCICIHALSAFMRESLTSSFRFLFKQSASVIRREDIVRAQEAAEDSAKARGGRSRLLHKFCITSALGDLPFISHSGLPGGGTPRNRKSALFLALGEGSTGQWSLCRPYCVPRRGRYFCHNVSMQYVRSHNVCRVQGFLKEDKDVAASGNKRAVAQRIVRT